MGRHEKGRNRIPTPSCPSPSRPVPRERQDPGWRLHPVLSLSFLSPPSPFRPVPFRPVTSLSVTSHPSSLTLAYLQRSDFLGKYRQFHDFRKSLEMYIYHSRYARTACCAAGTSTCIRTIAELVACRRPTASGHAQHLLNSSRI